MVGYKWGFDMFNVSSVDALSYRMFGPDITILREEEDARPPEFFFSSQHLNELDNPAEVCARGDQLKALLDGACYLEKGYQFRPEPIRELWNLQTGSRLGRKDHPLGVSVFSKSVCKRPLTSLERATVSEKLLDGAIYTARTDPVVFGILMGLGIEGITWKSLYALTDTMKTNGFSGKELEAAGGTTSAELKNFKHTANSFSVLGTAARHGQTNFTPPTTPMTLDRAAAIVLSAARAFVVMRIRRAVASLAIPKSVDDGSRKQVYNQLPASAEHAHRSATEITEPDVGNAISEKNVSRTQRAKTWLNIAGALALFAVIPLLRRWRRK